MKRDPMFMVGRLWLKWLHSQNWSTDSMQPLPIQTQCDPYQNTCWFLCIYFQVDPKFHMEIQGTLNNQTNLGKDKQIPDFKIYHKATVVKTVWYGHKETRKSMA